MQPWQSDERLTFVVARRPLRALRQQRVPLLHARPSSAQPGANAAARAAKGAKKLKVPGHRQNQRAVHLRAASRILRFATAPRRRACILGCCAASPRLCVCRGTVPRCLLNTSRTTSAPPSNAPACCWLRRARAARSAWVAVASFSGHQPFGTWAATVGSHRAAQRRICLAALRRTTQGTAAAPGAALPASARPAARRCDVAEDSCVPHSLTAGAPQL